MYDVSLTESRKLYTIHLIYYTFDILRMESNMKLRVLTQINLSLNDEHILKGNIQHMYLIMNSLCTCFYSIKSRFVRYATSACACIMCVESISSTSFVLGMYIRGFQIGDYVFKSGLLYHKSKTNQVQDRNKFFFLCALEAFLPLHMGKCCC